MSKRERMEALQAKKRDMRQEMLRSGLTRRSRGRRGYRGPSAGLFNAAVPSYAAAELAKLGFLPVVDAPARPSPWLGFHQLFPGLSIRKPRSRST